ncbi:hypothetical protein CRUP_012629, partial [Coryphaenoides rupestris]
MTEASRRRFVDLSPIKKHDSNKENDLPALSLIQFSKAPFVAFGTVKLGSSKSCLLRVDNPTEDAVAEKSLWDAIKNKRAANPTATPRCKNNESTLKMTANKTFQVPRKPQYKREKPRSPLALLNKAVDFRERPLSKLRSVEDGQEQQPPHKAAQRSEVRSPPGVTLSEALAIINSDLCTVSTSNSEIISNSLDSVCGSPRPEPVKLSHGVIPDSPELSDCNGQRCTFFVSQSAIAGHGVVGPVTESVPVNQEVKKVAFTSTTVTKSRAVVAVIAVPDVCSPGGRRIRKSRRRLLEKTLDLSEGGSSSSSPSASSPGPPVIDLHSGSFAGPSRTTNSPHAPPTPVIFPIASLPDLFPTPPIPPRAAAQLGPTKSKKRKSDEYMRSEELAGRGNRDKRSRDIVAVVRESAKPARQKKWSQRQHDSAGARSLKAIGTGPARTAKVVAVALAKLTFIKPAQTAKNMFYDERWLEKQESGFTCWINYILTPDDFKVNLEKVHNVDIAFQVLKAKGVDLRDEH